MNTTHTTINNNAISVHIRLGKESWNTRGGEIQAKNNKKHANHIQNAKFDPFQLTHSSNTTTNNRHTHLHYKRRFRKKEWVQTTKNWRRKVHSSNNSNKTILPFAFFVCSSYGRLQLLNIFVYHKHILVYDLTWYVNYTRY